MIIIFNSCENQVSLTVSIGRSLPIAPAGMVVTERVPSHSTPSTICLAMLAGVGRVLGNIINRRKRGGGFFGQREVEGQNALDFNRHARKLRRFEHPLARGLKRGVAKRRMPGNNSRVDHFSGLADEYLHLYGARSPGGLCNWRIRRLPLSACASLQYSP